MIPNVVLTLGPQGTLIAQRDPLPGDHDHRGCTCCMHLPSASGEQRLRFKHLKPRPIKPISVTGAGDSLVGVLVAGLAKFPDGMDRLDDIVGMGMRAAEMSLMSEGAVSEGIGAGILEEVEVEEVDEDDRDWG